MNKKGDRFAEKRVKLNSKLQNKILIEVKMYNQLTWCELAANLNLSEHTVRHDWRRKGSTIPLSVFRALIKMHPSLTFEKLRKYLEIIEPFWGQRIGKKSRIEDRIQIPKINSAEFAEFYGMLLGDGCIYSNLSGFCISSNTSTDKDYLEKRIAVLVSDLFNIPPKIYYSKKSKAINCVLYSKKIAGFLSGLGFPQGKKKEGNVRFLNIFFNDDELCKACIRGLVDTDGSISPHPNSKITLHLSITSKSLLSSCIRAFKQLNIPFGAYNKGINLYGRDKIDLYFKLVGSSNIKHIYKYRTFLTEGKVPNTFKTQEFLSGGKTFEAELPYYGPVV